mgnify:CR=1 FL=1
MPTAPAIAIECDGPGHPAAATVVEAMLEGMGSVPATSRKHGISDRRSVHRYRSRVCRSPWRLNGAGAYSAAILPGSRIKEGGQRPLSGFVSLVASGEGVEQGSRFNFWGDVLDGGMKLLLMALLVSFFFTFYILKTIIYYEFTDSSSSQFLFVVRM